MHEKYVIKGTIKNKTVYFSRFENVTLFNTNFEARTVSEKLSEATLFDDILIVENVCRKLGSNFKIYPVCPLCNKEYAERPAISRIDNKTRICPACGVKEALISFINFYQKKKTTNS